MKKGFTIIEVLVIIAIIGILSSVVLASLQSARCKSDPKGCDKDQPSCLTYANYAYKDVPARCIQSFERPGK